MGDNEKLLEAIKSKRNEYLIDIRKCKSKNLLRVNRKKLMDSVKDVEFANSVQLDPSQGLYDVRLDLDFNHLSMSFLDALKDRDFEKLGKTVEKIRIAIAIGDDLLREQFLDTDIADEICKLFDPEFYGEVKIMVESSWIIANVTSGPFERVKRLLKFDLTRRATNLFEHSNIQVQENSVWILANISGESLDVRNYLLENKIINRIETLMDKLQDENSLSIQVARLISNLFRERPDFQKGFPLLKHTRCFLKRYSQSSSSDEKEAYLNVLWVLVHISYKEAFEVLFDTLALVKNNSGKPAIRLQDLSKTLSGKDLLDFGDVAQEVEQSFGAQELHKFQGMRHKIKKLAEAYNEFPYFSEILGTPNKSPIHFALGFCRRVISLPLLFECVYAWRFNQNEEQELDNFSEFVQESGISSNYLVFKTLVENLSQQKINEVLLEKIKTCLQETNTNKISLLLAIFNEILTQPRFTYSYCRELCTADCKAVKVNDDSVEGQMLLQVKANLNSLLKKKFKSISRVLKVYEVLATAEKDPQTLELDSLDLEVSDPDHLIKKVDEAFPEEILFFPFEDCWTITHSNGGIAPSSDIILDPKDPSSRAIALFTFLCEFAQWRKLMLMRSQNPMSQAPPSVKSLCKNRKLTTGSLLENEVFGGQIYLSNLTEDMALKLKNADKLDEEDRDLILKKLTAEPTHPSGGKKSNYLGDFARRTCGNDIIFNNFDSITRKIHY